MGWISGWSHRKTITITGQAGAGTDYQVNLSIGDASGGDFHLENHCTSFPNDITVTDNDQSTLLDHWVEDLTVDPISMWIEVADSLESNADVCIYYDKTGESSASNIGNTFIYGNNFSSSAGWTFSDTAKINIADGVLKVLAGSGEASAYVTSKPTLGYDFVIEFDFWKRYSSEPAGESGSAIGVSASINPYTEVTNAIDHRFYDDGSHIMYIYTVTDSSGDNGTQLANPVQNELYKTQLKVLSGSTAYKIWDTSHSEGSPNVEGSLTSKDNYEWPYIALGTRADSNRLPSEYDDFRIRKYQATEPAFSSAGSEENAPVVGAIMNQFQGANIGADLYDGALIT